MPAFTQKLRGAVQMTPGRAAQQPNEQRPPKAGKPAKGGKQPFGADANGTDLIDLQRRRDQLNARVAELQWDLGGLVYEMAIRDRIRIDVIVRRAAELQAADAELSEVERILRLEETSTAGECASCGAPHSVGAVYCWQCGQPLLKQVSHDAIGA
jgi:chorismate mutase